MATDGNTCNVLDKVMFGTGEMKIDGAFADGSSKPSMSNVRFEIGA
jgi:hypothetical protein